MSEVLPAMPKGWKSLALGDICDVDPEMLSGATRPDYEFRYIDIASVSPNTIAHDLSLEKFNSAPSRARKKVKRNDVLMATVRPNLKAFAKVDREGDLVASTGFAVLRARAGESHPEFLKQVLFSEGIERQVESLVAGSNYPAITVGNVRRLQVAVPGYEEQRGIAEVLSALDEQIEQTESSVEKQRTICTGLLQDLFPEGFDVDSKPQPVLADALLCIESGKSFMCSDKPAEQGRWGVLKVSAVRPDGFESIENKSVENLQLVNEQYEVKHGDLLITRANTPALVAAACLVDTPQSKLLLCDKTLRLRPAAGVSPTYLWLWLQTPVVRKHIDAHATGTSAGMKNISQKAIKSIPIHLPDWATQVNRAEPVVSQLDLLRELKTEAAKLRLQKQGLMRDLLTGKVRVV